MIMRVSSVIILIILITLTYLSFSVATLCSSENTIDFLKIADSKADSFLLENNHALVIYGKDKVYIVPNYKIPIGKEENYMGVKIFKLNDRTEALFNGFIVIGNESSVKKLVKDVLSGNNMYAYLKKLNIGNENLERAVYIYVLNKNYCPYANKPLVVIVKKVDKKFEVIAYDGSWKKFENVRNPKMAIHHLTKKVLYFSFDFSNLSNSNFMSKP